MRQLLRYLDVADCDMEQGGMRLEANISLRKKGTKELPSYKVEIKNINSFRFMEQAIDYELERQAKILDSGETPQQETRGWDATKNQTFSQRSKEEAEDYRYFPEPDIPPIRFTEDQVEKIKSALPETPQQVAGRWEKDYELTAAQAAQLSTVESESELAWLDSILKLLNQQKLDIQLFANDLINKKLSVTQKLTPEEVVKRFESLHATEEIDGGELAGLIQEVLKNNQDAVEKYQAGEQQVLGFLMGQVLGKIDKKLDPKQVRNALQTALED